MATSPQWRNRIVGTGDEAPDQLLANPDNFRIHPKHQQDALAGALNEVGWIQQVVVNQRTGHVIDGHLRVSLAISKGEPTVPVLYVDLDEAEEKLALATFDPISAQAVTDQEQLALLLADVRTGEAGLQALLDKLAQGAGLVLPPAPDGTPPPGAAYQQQFAVAVICNDEDDQRVIFERLQEEGYECRVLVV